jgi:hypothetical protein
MQIFHDQIYNAQLTLSVYPPVQLDTVRNTGSVNPDPEYCIHELITLHIVYGSVSFIIKNDLLLRGAAKYAAVPCVVYDPVLTACTSASGTVLCTGSVRYVRCGADNLKI